MISDMAGFFVSVAPIVGLLAWRRHVDRRAQPASRTTSERWPNRYEVMVDRGGES